MGYTACMKRSAWESMAEWWDKEASDTGTLHQRTDIDPVIWKLIGSVRDRRILEIGCGNGYFARLLARRGGVVTAIDQAKTFINLARQRTAGGLNLQFLQRHASKLTGIKRSSFDLVIANMSLMDIRDLSATVSEASRVLKSHGRLIFSILHPLYSDFHHEMTVADNHRVFARVLSRYMSPTIHRFQWKNGLTTVHYHRPIGEYVEQLQRADFLIENIREITAHVPMVKVSRRHDILYRFTRRYVTAAEKRIKLRARQEFPLFLVMSAVKKG